MQIAAQCRAITPSVTLAIDAKAKAMIAQGIDVVGFGAGEPDFDTPKNICEAAKVAMDKGLTRYTPAAGMGMLQEAIAQKLHKENGLLYAPSQILVSCGAKHSLYNAFYTLLEPGDQVLIPAPCWVSYPEQVRMVGGEPVFVHADAAQDFKPTIEQWRAAITPRTRAFLLNSPNNPNGCVWTRRELEALAELALEHDVAIIADEIYEHLIYDGEKHVSIATLSDAVKERTILINGVSKSYAMTGWRIGYMAAPEPFIKAATAFQSHATSAPTTFAQAASIEALMGPQEAVGAMCRQFDQRRKVLYERVNAIEGLACSCPKGAFYMMVNIQGALGKSLEGQTIATPMDFAQMLLAHAQVAVVPGEAFLADTYCRLSYATSMENIAKGMDRIQAFMEKLQ